MDPLPRPRDWNRVCQGAGAGLFLAFALALFLLPPDFLIGTARADLGQQFLAWRAFAAASLRAGHWPLWNPYNYAGEPFLGGFQSAVFYPANVLFLIFPLCRAANLSLLVHLFILAAGMYRWAARRGVHPLAAGLAGLLLALSGPVFPHLYAGHLSNLSTLAWAPWIFDGLEDWTRGGTRRSLLLASAAVCLQILAGQMQYAVLHGDRSGNARGGPVARGARGQAPRDPGRRGNLPWRQGRRARRGPAYSRNRRRGRGPAADPARSRLRRAILLPAGEPPHAHRPGILWRSHRTPLLGALLPLGNGSLFLGRVRIGASHDRPVRSR